MSTARQQVLLQTLATRQNAEKLLASLLRAQVECDQQLRKEQRSDAMRAVTGSSSIDKAIASTRRMIEQLDRAIQDARRELDAATRAEPDAAGPPDPSPARAGAPAGCEIHVLVGRVAAAAR